MNPVRDCTSSTYKYMIPRARYTTSLMSISVTDGNALRKSVSYL